LQHTRIQGFVKAMTRGVLAGTLTPAAFAQDPATIPFVKPGCPNPEAQARGEKPEPVDRMDLGKAPGGGLFLARGRDLFEWRMTDRGQRFLQQRSLPAPVPSAGVKGFLSQSVWRNGTFYCQAGRAIHRLEGVTRAWRKVLEVPEDFEAFDVAPDGDIALLGSGRHLLRLFHEGAEKPFHEVPFPALDLEGADRAFEARLWKTLKSQVCDEFLVIYAGDLGRLYSFDFSARKLREAPTPWKPMNTKGLAQRAAREGMVLCNGFPSPGCLQLVPDEGLSVKVVYSLRTLEILPKANPNQRLPSVKVAEGKNPPLKSYDWDLVGNGRSEAVEEIGLAFPVWLNSRGFLEPLGHVLAKVQEAPPKREKEQPGGPAPR
jgi:hypothetical protein